MQAVIDVISELVDEAGKPLWDWAPPQQMQRWWPASPSWPRPICARPSRSSRSRRATQRGRDCATECWARSSTDAADARRRSTVKGLFSDLEAKIVRGQILDGEPRIDGRDTRTVRPISIRTGVLPRAHGSALFTRGETQALVVATLGTSRDEQIIDALQGEYRDRFMLHYSMPPYATGETGRVGSPKRREIGHGRLAKRALLAVLPTAEEFGYSFRVVSEITESNGSSSMASVCGGCLALMDAGVPLKAHVAGIAMGLIKEGNRFAVLTDILGDEDHLGDMDFKVAGTENGITALQMDIKIRASPRRSCTSRSAGARRRGFTSSIDEAGDGRAARGDLDLRAAHHHHEDQAREDPRRHRQGRRRDPCADRGDRYHHRYRRRMAR